MNDTSMDLRSVFRRNLRRLRKQNGLTQTELSRRIDFERTYAGKIERGEADPSFEAIERIAAVLGVTPADLMRGDKD